MPSNIEIKITAEVTDLQAKFAVARAESAALTRELSALAKQAATSGMTDELKAQLTQAAEASLNAKNRVAELQKQLDSLKPPAQVGREGLFYQFLDIAVATAAFETFKHAVDLVGQALEGTVGKAEEFNLNTALFARELGISEEAAAGLSAGLKAVGSSTDEYVSMALKLDRQVKTNEESLNKLGMATRDSSGNLLSQTQLMASAITAMQQFQEGTDQNEFAMMAFGRSAKDVYDIMRVTPEAVNTLTQDMRELGVVTGPDATAASRQFEEALARQGQKIEDVKVALGEHLMPILTQYLNTLNDTSVFKTFEDAMLGLAEITMKVSASIAAALVVVSTGIREAVDVAVGAARTAGDIATLDFSGAAKASGEAWQHMKNDASNAGAQIHDIFTALDADVTRLEQGVRGAAGTKPPPAPGTQPFVDPAAGKKAADDARKIADEVAQAWQKTQEERIAGEQTANAFMLEMGRETLDQFITQARDLENQRYAIELEGLRRREAADSGNAVSYARDKAQEDVIAQAHANRLEAIDEDYQRKKKQIEQTDLQDFIKTEQDKLSETIKHLDAAYKAGQITSQEKHDLEQTLTLDIEQQVLARFDAENAGLVRGTEAYAQAMRARQALVDGFTQHVEQQDDKLTEELTASWKKNLAPIESGFSGLISSMIGHTQSFAQAVRQMGVTIADGFAQMGVKWLFNWIATQLGMTAATKAATAADVATAQAGEAAKTAATTAGTAARTAVGATENSSFLGRIFSQIGEWLGLETTKTADTVAGTAARTTAAATETAATVAAAKVQAAGEIPAYTGIAAMEAASAVAGIPIVGPALATAAVAEMDALGSAQLALASAEGGQERVLSAEQLTLLHKDESVLPARIARPLMELVQNAPAIPSPEIVAKLSAQIARISSLGTHPINLSRAPSLPEPSRAAFASGGAPQTQTGESTGTAASSAGDTHVHLGGMSIVTPGPDAMKAWMRSNEGRTEMRRFFTDAARSGFRPK